MSTDTEQAVIAACQLLCDTLIEGDIRLSSRGLAALYTATNALTVYEQERDEDRRTARKKLHKTVWDYYHHG